MSFGHLSSDELPSVSCFRPLPGDLLCVFGFISHNVSSWT